jgi:hypothetical protein
LSPGASLTCADARIVIEMSLVFSQYNVAFLSARQRDVSLGLLLSRADG